MAYLDHNATTPLDPKVLEAMLPYFERHYGNPSSRHEYGRQARKAVDDAREQVAMAVGAHPSQVFFVSGGTEGNNWVLKGACVGLRPSQLVVSPLEHPSVALPAEALSRQGWTLRKLAVDGEGRVDLEDFKAALETPTGLVSVMLANNETGVVQNVPRLASLAREKGVWLHTDAVQALGKTAVDFSALQVHAMTLSAHKIYGPKGIGAVVVDKRLDLAPLIAGGGHEKGLRGGTENVPAIVGFGVACQLAQERLQEAGSRIQGLRDRLEVGVVRLGATLFGRGAERLPNTSFFAFPGIEGETLVMELDRDGFALGSGSACSSGKTQPSPVLTAMGVDADLARGAVRASLGMGTAPEAIDGFLRALEAVLARLRKLSTVVTV